MITDHLHSVEIRALIRSSVTGLYVPLVSEDRSFFFTLAERPGSRRAVNFLTYQRHLLVATV